MIAGKIIGISYLPDRIRFTVELSGEIGREAFIEVYPTGDAKAVSLGDTVWTQSGMAMLNGPEHKPDTRLWLIREDESPHYVWTLEEAKRGGRTGRGAVNPVQQG